MGIRYTTRIGLLLIAALFAACKEEKKGPPPAEFYLVVDTSGSMVVGTMKKVKEKLPSILSTVHTGDRVHLIHFDERAESVMDTTVMTDQDRKKITDAIDKLEPRGRFTEMGKLLDFLRQNVKPAVGGGAQYVIVLSDGVDDPAPRKGPRARAPRVDLKKFESSEKLAVQEPYVFYIHLGSTPGSDRALKENLKDLGSDVRVVRPGEKSADIGVGEVQKQIDATRPVAQPFYRLWWDRFMVLPLKIRAAIGAGLAFLLLLLYFLIPRQKKPLVGVLGYRENTEHPSMMREVRLDKFRRSDLLIGSGRESLIRIKDPAFPQRVRLKAKGSGANFCFAAAKKDLQQMVFLVQKKPGRISSGDSFRINNYTFEYTHGSKK